VRRLAESLDAAAGELTAAVRVLPALALPDDPPDGPGRPARIHRDVHARWAALLTARAHEAAAAAARLTAAAQAVRETAAGYADTDDAVARRLRREA
jgi:hypothetical protein